MQVGDKIRVLGTDGLPLGEEFTTHIGGGIGTVTLIDDTGFEVKFPKDTVRFGSSAVNDVEVIS